MLGGQWWVSDEQDGSGYDIFARRFGRVIPDAENCPAIVDGTCTSGFSKGFVLIKETAGKEKLVAKLIKGPMIAQTDFGDPLAAAGTKYNLCIYDDTAELEVERAGDTNCSGGASVCWAALGPAPPDGKGYKYKDRLFSSDGVFKILYKAGDAGKSKAIVKGMGSNLPDNLASSLQSSTSVAIQLRSSNGVCLSGTASDVGKNDPDFFIAK